MNKINNLAAMTIVLVFLLNCIVVAEIPEGFKLSGKPKVFVKNDLYGHIDGGAELFHEFGFNELTVYQYKNGGQQIDVETYEMSDPKAALGIYLMKSNQENPMEGVEARSTGTSWQYTIVKGNFFVLVNSYSGNDNLTAAMTLLANHHLESIKDSDDIALPDSLLATDMVPGSERIFCGPYGLQSVYTFGQGDVFNLNGKVYGLSAEYEYSADTLYSRIVIPYPDVKSANEAFIKIRKNLDPYLKIIEYWDTGFDFKDYQLKYGTIQLKKKVIDIKVHLPEKPEH